MQICNAQFYNVLATYGKGRISLFCTLSTPTPEERISGVNQESVIWHALALGIRGMYRANHDHTERDVDTHHAHIAIISSTRVEDKICFVMD